jgi:hypothetical protein
MTTGALIVFIVAIIGVGLFGIYAANHKEDDSKDKQHHK